MAKINLIKNNFTSGELSPHIWMRTDLQQYRNGTKEMLNFLPIVEGGLKRRGGTEALAVTAGAVRILPFIYPDESLGKDPSEWGEGATYKCVCSIGKVAIKRL